MDSSAETLQDVIQALANDTSSQVRKMANKCRKQLCEMKEFVMEWFPWTHSVDSLKLPQALFAEWPHSELVECGFPKPGIDIQHASITSGLGTGGTCTAIVHIPKSCFDDWDLDHYRIWKKHRIYVELFLNELAKYMSQHCDQNKPQLKHLFGLKYVSFIQAELAQDVIVDFVFVIDKTFCGSAPSHGNEDGCFLESGPDFVPSPNYGRAALIMTRLYVAICGRNSEYSKDCLDALCLGWKWCSQRTGLVSDKLVPCLWAGIMSSEICGEYPNAFSRFKRTLELLAHVRESEPCLQLLKTFFFSPGDIETIGYEARHSLYMMDHQDPKVWVDSLLLTPSHPCVVFDMVVRFKWHRLSQLDIHLFDPNHVRRNDGNVFQTLSEYICGLLVEGMGDRIHRLQMVSSRCAEERMELEIGLELGAEAWRLLDKGPLVENKVEATRFREFWGDKSKLRKFGDLSVHETLVWQSDGNLGVYDIPRQMIEYILFRHIEQRLKKRFFDVEIIGQPNYRFVPRNGKLARLHAEFHAVSLILKSIPGTLSIQSIVPLSSSFRDTNASFALDETDGTYPPPTNVREYNGTMVVNVHHVLLNLHKSNRWPSNQNPLAICSLMSAYFLHVSKLLEPVAKEGGNQTWTSIFHSSRFPPFLDIFFNGFVFRCFVNTDDILGDLEVAEDLMSITCSGQSKLVKWREGLETLPQVRQYDGCCFWSFKRALAHQNFIGELVHLHPSFSAGTRLFGLWLGHHYFASAVPIETVESMVAHACFLSWKACRLDGLMFTTYGRIPHSPLLVFIRMLHFLGSYDFENNPCVIPHEIRDPAAEIEFGRQQFQLWRTCRTKESHNSVYNSHISVIFTQDQSVLYSYSTGPMSNSEFERLCSMARRAWSTIALGGECGSIWKRNTRHFDLVLHYDLKAAMAGFRSASKSKIQRLDASEADHLGWILLPGFDPIAYLKDHLFQLFGEWLTVRELPRVLSKRGKLELGIYYHPKHKTDPSGFVAAMSRLAHNQKSVVELSRLFSKVQDIEAHVRQSIASLGERLVLFE